MSTVQLKATAAGKPVRGKGGYIVGYVENGVFYKIITNHRHQYLYAPASLACDVEALQQAVKLGATVFQVYDEIRGYVWRVGIEEFFAKSFYVPWKVGEQRQLPLRHWVELTGRKDEGIAMVEALNPKQAPLKSNKLPMEMID